MTNTTLITVGLVGCGSAGRSIHARLLRKYADRYTIVKCADVNQAAADALANELGAEAAPNVEALIADPAIELIVVATKPPVTHRDVAVAALAAGKHVVVEKPMAETAEQCAEMIKAAERAGRLLTVHHNRRWDVDFLTAQDAVKSGALGALRLVRNEFTAGFGGSPYDWAIHLVDQTMCLSLGMPFVELSATFCRPAPDAAACEGFFSARLRTEDGVAHDLSMLPAVAGSAYRPGVMPYRFVLVGTQGIVYQQWCQRPEDALARPVSSQLAEPKKALPETVSVKAELAVPDFYQRLFAAVRRGEPPPVPPRQAMRAVQAWELICRSAREGRTLSVEL